MMYNEPATNKLRLMVDEIMDDWRSGSKPDAEAMLEKYPQLRDRHSLAIDLAYEEFCLREESGEAIDPKQFCNRFGRLRNSLARMLNMHRVLHSTSVGMPKPADTDWPIVGANWCGWLLLEELGRGGFSRVFLAEEPALGNRRVVVKCSTSGPAEAFTLGKLEHPQIMPIHSIKHDDARGLVGICMPFCGRATLAEAIDQLLIDETPNSPASPALQAARANSKNSLAYSLAVARLMEKVARGLAAAHQAGVLHGDIKPSNIIQSFGDEPLLMDFNLSTDGEQGALRIGGTPPYMAPERLPKLAMAEVAKPGEEEYRSDIFSLGVVFAELLYGQIPFDFEVEDLHVRYTPALPKSTELNLAAQTVPAELKSLVERSIALNPEDRFASAQQMADALATFIKSHEKTKRLIRLAWIVCLVVILLAGWGFAASMLKRSPKQQLLHEAIADLNEKDWNHASERLNQLYQQVPRREIVAMEGWCYANLKKVDIAKRLFEEARPEEDKTGALWHNIGCCNFSRNALEPAIEDFTRAIALDPNNRQAYRYRALAKFRYAMAHKTTLTNDTFKDIELALSDDKAPPGLFIDAAFIYEFGMRDRPELRAEVEQNLRRALKAGVSPAVFAGPTFQAFEILKLAPNPLPPSITLPDKTEMFRPLPYDLRALLPDVR